MATTKFTKDHEWIRVENGSATVGITRHAQEQLGDLVYVELPPIGREVAAGDEIAVVESVKAASEVYAPIGGTITEVNQSIADEPAKVNGDAEGEGWFVKMAMTDPSEVDSLMDEAAYVEYCEGLD